MEGPERNVCDLHATTHTARGDRSRREICDAILETREKVVATVAQADHILLQEIPSINADYAVRIGCWQTRLLEAELACRRAKRRLALVQARLNRGITVDLESIESQLERELAEWQANVDKAYARLNEGLARATWTAPMTPAEVQRMKSLYRTLAKRLHPDLNPAQPEEALALFQMAKSAYENGQLDVLEALEVSTRRYERSEADLDTLSYEELLMELELCEVELSVMEDRLARLLADPLLELGRNLEDPTWVSATVGALKRTTAEFDEARRDYEARLSSIMGAAQQGGDHDHVA